MSNGNHASKAGFDISGGPNGLPACDSIPEPRGPGVFFAGLCVACGRSTIHRGADGLPRHRLMSQRRMGTCSSCGELMVVYARGQRAHPSCTGPSAQGRPRHDRPGLHPPQLPSNRMEEPKL